jgi:hypothetical protein
MLYCMWMVANISFFFLLYVSFKVVQLLRQGLSLIASVVFVVGGRALPHKLQYGKIPVNPVSIFALYDF